MIAISRLKFRFSLATLLTLILGIAMGYSLNLWSLLLMTGPANEARMRSLPAYVIEPPDVLQIDVYSNSPDAATISGKHLVGPDGRVNLGRLGTVYVAGMTTAEAQNAIERIAARSIKSPKVVVDIASYASKTYYIVLRGEGAADEVFQVPITGNETALDGIAQLGGLKDPASVKIWIARPAPSGVGTETTLPVEWDKIAGRASAATNYQLMPGDRLFVAHKSRLANK